MKIKAFQFNYNPKIDILDLYLYKSQLTVVGTQERQRFPSNPISDIGNLYFIINAILSQVRLDLESYSMESITPMLNGRLKRTKMDL